MNMIEKAMAVKRFGRSLIGRKARSVVTGKEGEITDGGADVYLHSMTHWFILETDEDTGAYEQLRLDQLEFLDGPPPALELEQPKAQIESEK